MCAMTGHPKPWPRLRSERGPNLMICRVRYDDLINPRTGAPMRRTVLETPDWVNVVALTGERELVVVRQFRFGTSKVTTEIPGGVVGREESSREAAQRELREETGYTSETWTYLGSVEPNPAFHTNVCHHWLAEGARATHPIELDSGEDICVALLSAEQLKQAVQDGEIRHALVLTALARLFDLRDGHFTDTGPNGSGNDSRKP
jgi:8-oxo-dGTP pyrophosphatase MutT (NUDIX family)